MNKPHLKHVVTPSSLLYSTLYTYTQWLCMSDLTIQQFRWLRWLCCSFRQFSRCMGYKVKINQLTTSVYPFSLVFFAAQATSSFKDLNKDICKVLWDFCPSPVKQKIETVVYIVCKVIYFPWLMFRFHPLHRLRLWDHLKDRTERPLKQLTASLKQTSTW